MEVICLDLYRPYPVRCGGEILLWYLLYNFAHGLPDCSRRTAAACCRGANVSLGRARLPCRKVVEGLEQPWSLAFLPDGRMLVTEKAGRLRVIAQGKLDPRSVEGLPEVTVHGQGGLHDVALHPEFAKNSLVYLAYAAKGATASAPSSRADACPAIASREWRCSSGRPEGPRRPAFRRPHRLRP